MVGSETIPELRDPVDPSTRPLQLQLHTFIRENVMRKKNDVSQMFFKILRNWAWTKDLKPKMRDDAVYQLIQLHVKPTDTKAVNPVRANARIREIRELIGSPKLNSYLDYGAEDNTISEIIGAEFATSTYVVDISEPHAMNRTYDARFQPLADGLIPFARTFDLITVFMVLHRKREEDLDVIVRDIRSHCAKGAYVVLREHDARNVDDDYLCTVEHYLHGVTNGVSYQKFMKSYYAHCHCWEYWKSVFEVYGFTFERMLEPRGATRYIALVFRWTRDAVDDLSPEGLQELNRQFDELNESYTRIRDYGLPA